MSCNHVTAAVVAAPSSETNFLTLTPQTTSFYASRADPMKDLNIKYKNFFE